MANNHKLIETEIGTIPEHWELKSLTDLISNIVDNRGKSAPTSDEGIALIATNCIKENGLYPTKEKIRFVSEETYDTWFRDHPKPGDIIIVNKGTPGLVCLVPEKVDFCIAQDMVALTPDENSTYGKYLFAAMRSHKFKFQVDSLNVGTTIPHLKKTVFSKLFIPIPPIEEQIIIGDIYCSLSEKIELNCRMNITIEAIGQAIFKHWFVDFEFPNEEGKPYKSSGGDMKETEFGEVPVGWKIKNLYSCAQFINGSSFRNTDFSTNLFGLPIIKIAELKNGVTSQTKFTTKEIDYKYKIKNSDILFSWSGSPDTSIDIFIWNGGDGWLNQHIFKVNVHHDKEKYFIYFLLRYLKPTFIEIARNKQTTGLGHVTIRDMKKMRYVHPSNEIMELFNIKVRSLYDRMFVCDMESINLTSIRDALLPKLMSGEIRVNYTNQ